MKASILDMRRNPKKILDAIGRNEVVTLTNRGKDVARILPLESRTASKAAEHEAFGMWADREDMRDPAAYVRKLRKGRIHDL